MQQLNGHRQQTWFVNQRLLHEGESILHLLDDQAIPAMFLKGAALLLTCYDSYTLRPMSDIDVLIPDHNAMRAYDLLAAQGWRMTEADFAPKSRFVPIPAAVLQSLGQTSESLGESLERALRRRQRSEWRGVRFHVYNLIRLNRRRVSIGPLRYFRQWWGRPLH